VSRRGRQRGLTVVEMMISIGLGGLLLTGAFELQTAFNRQSRRQHQVADMQQSLRVARQMIERALRSAGAGLQGGTFRVDGSCSGQTVYHGVQFSNAGATQATFPVAKTVFDTNPADADTDPDWLQVITTDGNAGGTTTVQGAAGVNVCITDPSKFAAGDLFLITDPTGGTPVSCVHLLTGFSNATGCCPGTGNQCALRYSPGGNCYNQPGGSPCLAGGNLSGRQVRRLPANAVSVFLVERTRAGQCVNPPCLMLGTGRIAQAPAWQLVAEGIENLQVALVMNDGRVCGTRDPASLAFNSTDCITGAGCCDPSRARAVRFTITVRSSEAIPDYRQGAEPSAEDYVVAAANDGFLRRSVTAEVQLRNLP
jgi:type II secretory pathway pseudopilin PulG